MKIYEISKTDFYWFEMLTEKQYGHFQIFGDFTLQKQL